MNAEIREIYESDLGECTALIRASFATVAEEFSLTRENCPTNGAFMADGRLQADYDRGNKMFGLYADGQLCGFVQVCRLNERLCTLEKLSVPPALRHRGYGRMLMDHAKAYIRDLGAGAITIGVMDNHEVLKQWYLDYGFQVKEIKAFPHLPFDVCFMELPL